MWRKRSIRLKEKKSERADRVEKKYPLKAKKEQTSGQGEKEITA